MTLKIRPLKRSDLDEFDNFGFSTRGVAVELDGEVLGVAGVLHSNPVQAFSDMKDELRKHPRIIIKAMRAVGDIIKTYDVPVYAVASETEHNSVKVLERIGFEFSHKNHQGLVYRAGG